MPMNTVTRQVPAVMQRPVPMDDGVDQDTRSKWITAIDAMKAEDRQAFMLIVAAEMFDKLAQFSIGPAQRSIASTYADLCRYYSTTDAQARMDAAKRYSEENR